MPRDPMSRGGSGRGVLCSAAHRRRPATTHRHRPVIPMFRGSHRDTAPPRAQFECGSTVAETDASRQPVTLFSFASPTAVTRPLTPGPSCLQGSCKNGCGDQPRNTHRHAELVPPWMVRCQSKGLPNACRSRILPAALSKMATSVFLWAACTRVAQIHSIAAWQ